MNFIGLELTDIAMTLRGFVVGYVTNNRIKLDWIEYMAKQRRDLKGILRNTRASSEWIGEWVNSRNIWHTGSGKQQRRRRRGIW